MHRTISSRIKHRAKIYWTFPLTRLRGQSFSFDGLRFPYFLHTYNGTHLNERAIEVPIALHYLAGEVLEVGNVLNHYMPFPHDVVDKFEDANGVINVDVRKFRTSKRYDCIISISTLEHVGWDERPQESPEAFHEAHAALRELLAPGGKLVFTIPVGYNLWLDEQFRLGKIHVDEMHCFARDQGNHWKEVEYGAISNCTYNVPFPYANGLIVGINAPPAS